MQVPGLGTVKPHARVAAPARPTIPVREHLAFTLVPAVAATILALLLYSLDPGVLLITALILASMICAMLVHDRREMPQTIILVGRSPMSTILAASLEDHDQANRITVVRADHLGEATALARTLQCHEIVLADPAAPHADRLIDARGVQPIVVSGRDKLERLLNRVPLDFAETDRWFTRARDRSLADTSYAMGKRVIDIGFACGLGLIVLPLLPLVAMVIKLDSRGTVLYSQDRVGRHGRLFRIYKFRTMTTDAERHGPVWATRHDQRVTRIGRLMRKSRMDELPQLWNLIRGDMALVGPRPERPEFTARLIAELPSYDFRHAVKPGLTGWAQVSYRYASSVRDTRAKLEYDLYYVKHCGLLFDLQIMLRTFRVVLAMKGQ
jgi:exopolysaccharide biosynthesis polyprenyl glycosylphosphotransferase